MANQGNAVCVLQSVVRGYHIFYKAVWTPSVGEVLPVSREPGNGHNRYAVYVKRSGEIVGHVPRHNVVFSLSCFFSPRLISREKSTCY